MPRVYQQPAARNDLIEHYVYLTEEAGQSEANAAANPLSVSQTVHA